MLEIGCGTGVVSVSAALRGWNVDGCDVHPLAIAVARGLAEEQGVSERTSFWEGGLAEESDDGAWAGPGAFDIICWNPPYLDPVTLDEQRLGPLEEGALTDIEEGGGWAGLLRIFIEESSILADDGVVIIIHRLGERSGPTLESWIESGWSIRPLASTMFGDERLVALALWRGWGRIEPVRLERSASTMEDMPDEAATGSAVIARMQDRGQGRRGRIWNSEEGDLTATWRVSNRDGNIMHSGGGMQLEAGLAVADAIASRLQQVPPLLSWSGGIRVSRMGVQLKWPNDIMVEDVGKLGGILLRGRTFGESTTFDLGVGINGRGRIQDGERVAGFDDIGLGSDANTIFTALAACLGGRLEAHPRLPRSDVVTRSRAWWSLFSARFSRGGASLGFEADERPVGISEEGALMVADSAFVRSETQLDMDHGDGP